MDGTVCQCDADTGFEWDSSTSTCVCMSGYQESIDGICRLESESVKWSGDWGSCSSSVRERTMKTLTCTTDSSATAAPWISGCTVSRSTISEDCDDSTVICTDYNAEYDSSSGTCACSSGYTDTTYGCQEWSDAAGAISDDIVDEITTRLEAIYNAGTYSKFTATKYAKMTGDGKFWPKMKTKANSKANSVCGKRSRAANTYYYAAIQDLYDDFETYSAVSTTDLSTLTSLVELYNTFLKKGIFNCNNSGYGDDPTDGSTDANGVTCTSSNKTGTFKCRLQYRFAALYNGVFGSGTLSF